MKWMAGIVAALACAALGPGACVELCGQRITGSYDAQTDALYVLIDYDGIYGTGKDNNDDAVKQLGEFVANGDIMLVDWPFHFDMKEMREAAAKEDTAPRAREFLQALPTLVKVTAVGRYADFNNEAGAAQLVVVRPAKDFFAKANAALNEAITAEAKKDAEAVGEPGKVDYPRTLARIREAATAGHEWVAVRDGRLVVDIPIDAEECAQIKGKSLVELMKQNAKGEKHEELGVAQLASSANLFFSEAQGSYTFTLDLSKGPATLRWRERSRKFEPNLEKKLAEVVPSEFDKSLAQWLLGARSAAGDEVKKAVGLTPPEDRVRALVGVAEGPDEALRPKVLDQLDAIGKQWNKDQRQPVAPNRAEDVKVWLTAWKEWYGKMQLFPLTE